MHLISCVVCIFPKQSIFSTFLCVNSIQINKNQDVGFNFLLFQHIKIQHKSKKKEIGQTLLITDCDHKAYIFLCLVSFSQLCTQLADDTAVTGGARQCSADKIKTNHAQQQQNLLFPKLQSPRKACCNKFRFEVSAGKRGRMQQIHLLKFIV